MIEFFRAGSDILYMLRSRAQCVLNRSLEKTVRVQVEGNYTFPQCRIPLAFLYNLGTLDIVAKRRSYNFPVGVCVRLVATRA